MTLSTYRTVRMLVANDVQGTIKSPSNVKQKSWDMWHKDALLAGDTFRPACKSSGNMWTCIHAWMITMEWSHKLLQNGHNYSYQLPFKCWNALQTPCGRISYNWIPEGGRIFHRTSIQHQMLLVLPVLLELHNIFPPLSSSTTHLFHLFIVSYCIVITLLNGNKSSFHRVFHFRNYTEQIFNLSSGAPAAGSLIASWSTHFFLSLALK